MARSKYHIVYLDDQRADRDKYKALLEADGRLERSRRQGLPHEGLIGEGVGGVSGGINGAVAELN